MSESESKPVTEVPSFVPPRVIAREPFLDRAGMRDDEADSASPREGLPPSYRMRADSHYVDQLAGPPGSMTVQLVQVHNIQAADDEATPAPEALIKSIQAHGLLQPLLLQRYRGRHRVIDGHQRLSAAMAAGLDRLPCVVYDVDDATAVTLAEAANVQQRTSAAALTDPADQPPAAAPVIGEALASLMSAATLLTPGVAGLSRRAAESLIRAQAWRASCLASAARVLEGARPGREGSSTVAHVIARVAQQAAAEGQLRGVEIELAGSAPLGAAVRGDEELIVGGISGVLLTALAFVEDAPGARVVLTASSRSTSVLTLEATATGVRVPAPWPSRAFDCTWTDRPGGAGMLLMLLGAREVADAVNGQFTVAGGDGSVAIAIQFPLASRR